MSSYVFFKKPGLSRIYRSIQKHRTEFSIHHLPLWESQQDAMYLIVLENRQAWSLPGRWIWDSSHRAWGSAAQGAVIPSLPPSWPLLRKQPPSAYRDGLPFPLSPTPPASNQHWPSLFPPRAHSLSDHPWLRSIFTVNIQPQSFKVFVKFLYNLVPIYLSRLLINYSHANIPNLI